MTILSDEFVYFFEQLSASERVTFLYLLGKIWCPECGYEQPTTGRECQCWNDE